ncbi:hypothetical protein MBLNU459_g3050t1 [Dothideomycetes sp. NU459]
MASSSVGLSHRHDAPDQKESEAIDLDIHIACMTGDETKLERLLDAGARINRVVGPPNECDYPLNTAARTGSLSLVRVFLRHNADVQIGAIMDTAGRGDVEMLKLLLLPVKAHLAQNPTCARWRGDLAAVMRLAIKHGRGRIVEHLMVFQPRIPNFDELLEEGLVAASANDDLSSLKLFIRLGSRRIESALRAAAERGHVSIMQHLLENLPHATQQLYEPLAIAAGRGFIPTMDLFLSNGAIDQGRALLAAAEANEHRVLQYLMQRFAYDPQTLSEALSLAAAVGDVSSMQVLISHGAEDTGALNVAAQKGQLIAMRILLDSFEYQGDSLAIALSMAMSLWALDVEDSGSLYGDECRSYSILTGTYESANVLMQKGAKLSIDSYCQLLEFLILIPATDPQEYVAFLLQNRSKFTLMDKFPDEYLLSLTIYHKPLWDDVIKMLLEIPVRFTNDPQVSSLDSPDDSSIRAVYQKTLHQGSRSSPDIIPGPLLAAVLSKNESWCKILIERGTCDINAWCHYNPNKHPTSYYTRTPFPEHAPFAPHQYIFGNVKFQESPLSAAVRTKQSGVIQLLISHGADPWLNSGATSIFLLSGFGQPSLFRPLVALARTTPFFEVNKQESHGGRTLLHWTTHHDDADLVSDLIRDGADVDAQDAHLRTPLHVAVAAAAVESTKRLCFAGADLALRDAGRTSETPYECAERRLAGTTAAGPLHERMHTVVKFMRQWAANGLGRLEAAQIQRDYERYALDKAKEGGGRGRGGGGGGGGGGGELDAGRGTDDDATAARDEMDEVDIGFFSEEESLDFSDDNDDGNDADNHTS